MTFTTLTADMIRTQRDLALDNLEALYVQLDDDIDAISADTITRQQLICEFWRSLTDREIAAYEIEIALTISRDDAQRAYCDLDDACNSTTAAEDPDYIDVLDQRLLAARVRVDCWTEALAMTYQMR